MEVSMLALQDSAKRRIVLIAAAVGLLLVAGGCHYAHGDAYYGGSRGYSGGHGYHGGHGYQGRSHWKRQHHRRW
jgi:hypothetical protein